MFSALFGAVGPALESVGSFLGNETVASVLGGATSGLGSSLLGNLFGRKNAKDSAALSLSQYKRQRMFDADYAMNFEVPLQKDLTLWNNNVDYQLARRYAENSASWQVQGLRNANLNPILAANGGNISGSMGTAAPLASVPASGGSMPRNEIKPSQVDMKLDLASMLQTLASAKLLDSQSDAVEKKTDAEVGLLKAQMLKAEADTKAATATEWKTRNDAQSNAISGWKSLFELGGKNDEKYIIPAPSKAELILRKNPKEHSAKSYKSESDLRGPIWEGVREELKKSIWDNRE